MKTIFTFFLSLMLGVNAFSQYGTSTVTVTLNGSKNQQVLIDGRSYAASAYDNGGYQQTKKNQKNKGNKNRNDGSGDGKIVVNNLSNGQHTFQVANNYNQTGRRNNTQPIAFTLRQGYDLEIKVDGNGRISMKEGNYNQRNRGNTGGNTNGGYNNGGNNGGYNNGYRNPMTDANFNALYQDIQRKWLPGQKMTALRNSFNTAGYYFSTYQVRQLVLLVSGESSRLELLKLSFNKTSDTGNFTQLYDLLTTQAGRDELDYYIRQYR